MEKEQVQSLLRKFAANEHSPGELEALLTYFHENPHHDLSDFFEQLLTDNSNLTTENQKLRDAISDRVARHVFQKTHPTRYFSARRLLPYAAAILILLSAGIVMYRYQQQSSPVNNSTSRYGDDVLPGGNRATLSFSNGKSITLNENKDGIIAGKEQYVYSDGEAVPTTLNDIEYATLATPRGGQYQITLPDGTKVWLNAASSLRYPVVFNADERKVELVGEGYFEVVHNEQHPFIVESKGQSVQVLGTSFNINAYADEDAVATTLVNGSVRLHNTFSEREQLLKSGEQAVLLGETFQVQQVEVGDFTSWKNGLIVLNDADLTTIIRQVERWYDVEFVLPETTAAYKVFGELHRDVNLSQILNALHDYYGLSFKVEGRRIIVSN